MRVYVAVEIGCLECGVDSHILGIFEREDEAQRVCRERAEAEHWSKAGERSFEVLPAETECEI